jgi:hypothetical protein
LEDKQNLGVYVMKDKANQETKQASSTVLEGVREYIAPLVGELDAQIDKRLVRTFVKTLQAIVTFRPSSEGLLLSELGSYITSPSQAPAGTKRLSNLLRSPIWGAGVIERFLWRPASTRLAKLKEAREDGLLIWDDSILEKAASIAIEGLCAVRSSVAARLKRIKPGYFNPRVANLSLCQACSGSVFVIRLERLTSGGCNGLVDKSRQIRLRQTHSP